MVMAELVVLEDVLDIRNLIGIIDQVILPTSNQSDLVHRCTSTVAWTTLNSGEMSDL